MYILKDFFGSLVLCYNKLVDETQLNDLKQFIAATVSQATADMATKGDIADMATKGDIAKLSNKIDDLELKVDTISETLNENLSDHETRIIGLEQQSV